MKEKTAEPFYGWWIVTACFFIAFYTGGTVFFGFTAVFEPIAEEFGWSYAQVSLAASMRGLEMGALAPLVGLFVNRVGPRKLIFCGAILIGVGFMLLSRTSSLLTFYASFVLIATGMSCLSGTVLLSAVVSWFRNRLSMATGFVVSGFAAGGLLVFLVTVLIENYDWRTAMAILGISTIVIVILLSFMVRNNPSGSLKKSPSETTAERQNPAIQLQKDSTLKQALSNGTFWRIAIASTCHMLILSAVTTHIMPYLTSVGISRGTASLVASIVPISSIGGRVGLGWLGDRTDKRKIASLCFILMASGLLVLSRITAPQIWLVIPFAILYGTGWGGSVTMRAGLLADYFGRSRFGAIYGFLAGISMLGNIAGAPIAGWIFDNWGTYKPTWIGLSAVGVLAFVTVMTIGALKDKKSEAAG